MTDARLVRVFQEEMAILDSARGKTPELPPASVLTRSPEMNDIASHLRIETRLSLDEVLKEGKEHTIRRYSKAQIIPIEDVEVRIKQKRPISPILFELERPPRTILSLLKAPPKPKEEPATCQCRIM